MGDAGIRCLVHESVERAKQYQWISKRDASRFIVLSFIFGENFAGDPRLQWVSEIIDDQRYDTPSAKMDALYAKAESILMRNSQRK